MSKVREFVENEVKRESTDIGRRFRDRRVTVRLSGTEYGALKLLADRTGHTATGCAQGLLQNAIQDGLKVLGYETWADAQIDIVEALDEEPDPAEEDRP